MQIKKIMSRKPICLKSTNTLKDALRIMAENSLGGCPVINSSKKVIGMVSQSDILKIIDVHSRINTSSGQFHLIFAVIKGEDYDDLKETIKSMLGMKVKEFMGRSVVTVDENEDVYTAARIINSNDIERLPVLRKKRIIGIVTKKDFIRLLHKLEKK